MIKEKINFLILSENPEERLLEEIALANEAAGEETEIKAEVIHPFDIMLKIAKNDWTLQAFRRVAPENESEVYQTGLDMIPQFDAIITRLADNRAGQYGLNIIRHFQLQNVYSTASSWALECCQNYFRACQFLVRDKFEKLNIPTQLLMNGPADISSTLEFIDGLPVTARIIKQNHLIAETLIANTEQATILFDSVNTSEAEILISQGIKTGDGRTEKIKVLVMKPYSKGQKLFGYKVTTPFDFKNLDEIAAEPVELTADEITIVTRAANNFMLGFAEITLLRDKLHDNTPYLVDISANPNIKQAEKALPEVNISAELIDSVIDIVRERRQKGTNNIANVRSIESNYQVKNPLPISVIRDLNRVTKQIRLNANFQQRRLQNYEIEALSLIDNILNEL